MNGRTRLQPAKVPSSIQIPVRTPLLQRKCACGGTPGPTGECAECRDKRLQRRTTGEAGPSTLPPIVNQALDSPGQPLDVATRAHMEPRSGHDFGQVRTDTPRRMQPRLINRRPLDRYELEADRAAEQQALRMPEMRPPLSRTRPMIQRFPDDETGAPAEPTTEVSASDRSSALGLIAEDSADELGPDQMRRSEFLTQLRTSVRAATDTALTGTGCSSDDCPYIDYWFGYYADRDSQHIERAIHKYAPETRRATTASEYIYLVTDRVRRAVGVWSETGQITGVPEDVSTSPPATNPGNSPQPAGEVALKARDGGGMGEAGDPREVQAQLGAGRALDGAVRSRMESAFDADFSRVRVHSDARAAALSARLNARAFTIGSDIAFGAGEYRPGTPVGDALLAHELAHVVQQGGASSAARLKPEGGPAEDDPLEEDADWSAVGAVVSLWGGSKNALADIAKNATPRLRSGLALQRCACSLPPEKETPEKRFLTEPRDEPYGDLLKEASQDLERVAFGRAEKSKRSHSEYWDVVEPPLEVQGGHFVRDESKYKLILKKGKKLSEALDGLVRDAREAKSRDQWLTASLDCAQFVQAIHLIAVRRRLGSEAFDKKADELQQKMGPFQITADYSGAHYLALVSPSARYSRESGGTTPFKEYTWKDGLWEGGTEVPKTEEELLKEAPIGSRVTWKNSAEESGASFQIENSVKVDDNQYAAHGFTPGQGKNIFSELELKKALAPSEQAVKKAFGETVNANQWIDDFIKKYIFVTEIEHYRLPKPEPVTGPTK